MEAPEEVIPDQEFAIQVALTTEQFTPETKVMSGPTTTEGQLVLPLPAQDSWKIDVVMSAPGFTFRAGMNTSTLVLPRQGDSTPAVFYLRAKPIRGGRQLGRLYATLWYQGAYLAKVMRAVQIVAPAHAPRPTGAPSLRPLSFTSLPSMRAPTPLGQPIALHLGGLPPDLTLFLLEEEGILLLQSPHLQPSQHAFSTPKQLAEWLNTQYAHFVQEAERGLLKPDTDAMESLPRRERRLAFIRGVGRELYQKVAPTAFKDAFWRLRDQLGARFQSIQIYSSNPLIPWEIMRPSRANGAEERDFLGVEFRIARWHISQGDSQLERPPQTMLLQALAVIAPHYTESLMLPNQVSEIQALQRVAGYQRVPGQLAQVRALFAHVPTGIVHFSGHGVVQEKSKGIFEYAIRLEDVELDLLTWRGLASQHPQGHPFIFFNGSFPPIQSIRSQVSSCIY